MIKGIQIVTCVLLCLIVDLIVGIFTAILSLMIYVDFLEYFKYISSESSSESLFWKYTHMYIDSLD